MRRKSKRGRNITWDLHLFESAWSINFELICLYTFSEWELQFWTRCSVWLIASINILLTKSSPVKLVCSSKSSGSGTPYTFRAHFGYSNDSSELIRGSSTSQISASNALLTTKGDEEAWIIACILGMSCLILAISQMRASSSWSF